MRGPMGGTWGRLRAHLLLLQQQEGNLTQYLLLCGSLFMLYMLLW
jgi:hypothetical protein